ncbi:MAG TPA: formate dehydrogenase accessory protein FdhE [Vicinamibacterales bacterium]|jgi:FdhE protein|nr:formate dehydrogenase accessory protein FdhE [Vicinamibacterales bacterium]
MNRASMPELDTRLEAMVGGRPDLAPAAKLQRALLARMIQSSERLASDSGSAGAVLPPLEAVSRLRQGLPVMRGRTIELPVGGLSPDLAPLCDLLADGGAGDAARHIADALRSERIDHGSLLAASFDRDQPAVRTFALHASLAPDLLWLVAELASAPFAFVAQSRIFDDALAGGARDEWSRGYCPACGSWPAFAELTGGARRLRCSYCAASWQPSACRCVYCAEEGPAFSLAAPDESRPTWRLELCATCGGYLKSIETTHPVRFPLGAVDDMETTPLDVVAMDRGYGKPQLPEFGTPLLVSSAVPSAAPGARCQTPRTTPS